MVRLFVRHRVEDLGRWKEECGAYDEAESRRFAGSDKRRRVMESAGVVGDFDIWFTVPA